MATITSLGIGSGLDIATLVSQLVEAEGAPETSRLNRQRVDVESKLSAIGNFKNSLGEFQTVANSLDRLASFQSKIANSSDDDVFTASALSSSAMGTYDITVEQLAKQHKLASGSFADTTTTIGTGVLNFQFGKYDKDTNTFSSDSEKGIKSVTIGSTDGSLEGIRDAINSASIGVTSNIINDGSGNRLVFSSDDTGSENSLKITVDDIDGNNVDGSGLSILAYDPTSLVGSGKNISQVIEAKDAILTIDGITVTRPNNTVIGAISGVTLNLHSESPGSTKKLTVGNDTSRVSEEISKFVEQYNNLAKQTTALFGYDAENEKAGALISDSSLRSVSTSIRNIMADNVSGLSGNFSSMSELGISTNRDGTMTLNESVLQSAMLEDFHSVTRIFGSGSSSDDSFISVSRYTDETKPGSYSVNITQLATQGRLIGSTSNSLVIDANNDDLQFIIDGETTNKISLEQKAYTSYSDLALELQLKINSDENLQDSGITVGVEHDGNGFVITSSSYGSESSVEIISTDTNTLTDLGLSISNGIHGVDVAGTIGEMDASGYGQVLVGSGEAKGMRLTVSGGSLGDRGTVSVTRGIANQINKLLDDALGVDGTIKLQTDGHQKKLSDIDDRLDTLTERLSVIENRYRLQFSFLDALISNMKSTSNYLDQQLSSMPSSNKR